MPLPNATQTAAHHIRSAIVVLESEVAALNTLGVREGSIIQSPTSHGGIQHHWWHAGKRVYVGKTYLAQYQEEIQRGREVLRITRRIELLQGLISESEPWKPCQVS
jgi:hypothetical protein